MACPPRSSSASRARTLQRPSRARANPWVPRVFATGSPSRASRQQAAGTASIPAGMYSSVEFESLVGGSKTVRELVSFRFDEDNTWRASGYTVRNDAR
ncbi:DUF4019 domain-containing protein [Variovorax sp. AFSI2.2]|uniref:DUF4019 domain-containing protein n=1 Tax=Variovorax sp. AFSI2.2 TaxID=3384160 RepID=UPI003EC09E26